MLQRSLRRWVPAILAAGLLMAGCSGGAGGSASGGSTATGGTAAKSGKKLKIGVSVPAADHGWTAGIGWWAKQAMEMYPDVEWVYSTAQNPTKQIADIETMMAGNIDALVILATESAPLTPVAKQAKEKGIYIVNVDRGFTEPVADIFLEGDNKAFGRKSAQYMVEKMGGKGSVVILEGIPSTVNTDRVEAAMEVFKANPGITVLDRGIGKWNREEALKVMQSLLIKHKKIDAVWASDDDMALGVEQAIKEAGRTGEMWILGGAGMKDIVKRVMDKDPTFPANITYPPSMIATGIHLAVTTMQNKEKVVRFMPRHLMMDVELITPENAKDYYFPDSVY